MDTTLTLTFNPVVTLHNCGMTKLSNSKLTKYLGLFSTVTLAFTVSACNGGNSLDGGGGPNMNGDTPAAAAQNSPLNEYLGPLWGSNLSQAEQQRQQQQEDLYREELIAGCMREAGFEFIPTQVTVSEGLLTDDNFRPDDRDWVAQYGFALIHNPWANAATEPDHGPAPVDPNQEYLDSLSDAERAAFYEALFGFHGEDLPEGVIGDDGQILDMEAYRANMGCWGVAQQELEATSVSGLYNSAEFAPLFDAIGEMRRSVYDIPEFSVIDNDWANCMADAGHPGIPTQAHVQDELVEEYNSIIENWDWDLGEPNATNSPRIAAMGDREIELALADFDCRASTYWESRRMAIVYDAERQFITDHQTELNALRDAVEQRQ